MAFLSMGLAAAVCVGVGLGLGILVDSALHTAPAFLLVGLALGLAFGLSIAVLNLRFLDAGVAKLNTEGETSNKVLRRAIGTKSATRLGVITVICVGLLLLNGALGIGAVAGLVIFQLLFVVNVGRVIISQGIQ